ncbi:MAG: acetyl-CoA carboxylase biotin carboxyl carrier protein subunit [Chloroflexi bacterium]|nr:acetyl-CoA carboxylase biotin carboxyl carrier protein subunit [Chloroflexota bacterium]
MKLTVKIDNQSFTVEVGDLRTRPIIATIGETQFEVWPEMETASTTQNGQVGAARPFPASPTQAAAAPAAKSERARLVRAPIPGMVSAVMVQVDQVVVVGQPLCTLDAMKMSNTIRATRAGTIAGVTVTVGQHVKHNDVLVEYAD